MARSEIVTSPQLTMHKSAVLKLIGLVIAGTAFMIAEFSMAEWSEISVAHHTVQHVFLFISGTLVGAVVGASVRNARIVSRK